MEMFFLVFLKRKNWASAFFIVFSSGIHNGMLYSAGVRQYAKQQKNLEFEDKEEV